MMTVYGKQGIQDSEALARFGLRTMVPLLRGSKHDHVVGKRLRSDGFERHPDYRLVTRDADDTVVHNHDRHVFLMRSGLHVPDDTLICDHMEGLRALGRAALATDIAQKIKDAPESDNEELNERMENLASGFSFLGAGEKNDLEPLLRIGHTTLRTALQGIATVSDDIRQDIFRTLVRGQHEIAPALRTTVDWNDEHTDALLIGAWTGHARSLLRTDPDASQAEMEQAVGATKIDRGLHYAAFIPGETDDKVARAMQTVRTIVV